MSLHESEKEYGSEGIRDVIKEQAMGLIQDAFKDPLGMPAEFKAWLGPYLETAGLQIPVSQITGNTLTASHVDDLGGTIHGRMGALRVGTGLQDTLIMFYDEVSGKWASPPFLASGGASANTNNNTTYLYVRDFTTSPSAGIAVMPYDVFYEAGLDYETRTLLVVKSTSGNEASFKTTHSVQDPGSAVGSLGTADDWETSTTSTDRMVLDSGWRAKPASLEHADTVAFDLQAKISDAGDAWIHLTTTFFMRWVTRA